MKFTLEIEMGNDAMQTYSDICLALKNLKFASRLYIRQTNGSPHDGDGSKIMDRNGNSVGWWEVSE